MIKCDEEEEKTKPSEAVVEIKTTTKQHLTCTNNNLFFWTFLKLNHYTKIKS